MYFDEVFDYIGGAGPYQIVNLMFTVGILMIGVDSIQMNFIGGRQEHWCKIPGLEHFSYEQQKHIAIPYDEDSTSTNWLSSMLGLGVTAQKERDLSYESCYRFPLNFSSFTDEELVNWDRNSTSHFRPSDWIPCDRGWTYDQSLFVSTIGSEWDLVCGDLWMVDMISTFFFLGWVVGCIITGPISDRFGRRKTVILMHTIRCVGAYCCLYAPNYTLFAVGRAILGLASPNVGLVVYVIGELHFRIPDPAKPVRTEVAEVTSGKWRPTFGVLWNVGLACGAMFSPFIGYFVRDHFYFIAVLTWPLAYYFIYAVCLDESPRWLVSQGRYDEAIAILNKIATVNRHPTGLPPGTHFKEEHAKREAEGTKRLSYLDMFRTPNLRKKNLIVLFEWFTVGLIYYGFGLNAGRLPGSVYLNSFLLSFVEVPANLLGIFLLSRVGRRKTTGIATILSGVFSLLCIPFLFDSNLEDVATVFSVLGKAGSACGFGGIYVYTAELNPTSIRNIAFGTASMFARISGAASPFVGGSLGDLWKGLPSLVYGIFGLVAGGLVLCLPETLGAKLPETVLEAEEFGKKKKEDNFQEQLEKAESIGIDNPAYKEESKEDIGKDVTSFEEVNKEDLNQNGHVPPVINGGFESGIISTAL